MKRHHSNGRTLAVEGHTPGGGGRLPPIGGRHSHPPRGGWASTRGVQRPISLEYQICTPTIPFDTLVTGMPCTATGAPPLRDGGRGGIISQITMHTRRGTAHTGWGEHRCLKLLAHPPYERCPRTHGAPEGAQGCFLVGNN